MKAFTYLLLCAVTSLLFVACGAVKTHQDYKKTLPAIEQVAVLTPYVQVQLLTRNNDFEKEKTKIDSLKLQQGTQYIQHKILQELPQKFQGFHKNLSSEFTTISCKDIDVFFELLDKKKITAISVPAYLKTYLQQEKIQYAVISSYKGFYKTKLRNKQDEVAYNAAETLQGVFSATTVPEPLFPDDVIGTLYFVLYDVANDKLLYYSKEINSELAVPDVPIYPKAIDNQMAEIIRKLKKDMNCVANL